MTALDTLKLRLADLDAMHAAIAMMDWDQQTYMPHGAAEARAAHVGILSRMQHERSTSEEFLALLAKAEAETDPKTEDGAMLRVVRRNVDLATKLPTELVEKKSRLSA